MPTQALPAFWRRPSPTALAVVAGAGVGFMAGGFAGAYVGGALVASAFGTADRLDQGMGLGASLVGGVMDGTGAGGVWAGVTGDIVLNGQDDNLDWGGWDGRVFQGVTGALAFAPIVGAAGRVTGATAGAAAVSNRVATAALNTNTARTAILTTALRVGRLPKPLTHLTNPQNVNAIASSGKIGGKWGVFALEANKIPKSNLMRQVKTLVPGNLSGQISIPANAAKAFNKPPIFGPVSIARRLAGVRSTPLGSIELHSGRFVAGEIFKNGVFRQATRWEALKFRGHQLLLDYGFDIGLYATVPITIYQDEIADTIYRSLGIYDE